MDGEGKGLSWSHKMKLEVCSKLVHVFFKHTPLQEQRPSTSGWRRTFMVLSNEATSALKTSACIVETYSST